jgi:hypothetical protein
MHIYMADSNNVCATFPCKQTNNATGGGDAEGLEPGIHRASRQWQQRLEALTYNSDYKWAANEGLYFAI